MVRRLWEEGHANALTNREHGGRAAQQFLDAVENITDMHWNG